MFYRYFNYCFFILFIFLQNYGFEHKASAIVSFLKIQHHQALEDTLNIFSPQPLLEDPSQELIKSASENNTSMLGSLLLINEHYF